MLNKMLYRYKQVPFVSLARGLEEMKKLFVLLFRLAAGGVFWQ